ncbi:MAG TPA: HEAT repeat domain-containing protein [Acidimicrobiales bacterium]|nr:HEAT repeat domain-containing protein [Acidimicrobiales bacterium]
MPCSGEQAVLAVVGTHLLSQLVALAGGVFLVGLVLFLCHGAWSGAATRRNAARIAESQAELQLALDEEGSHADHRRLAALPRRLRIYVLAAVAPSLAGAHRQRLTALAAELGVLAWADAKCRSHLWWRRLHGVRVCTLLGGGATSVPPLLGDRRPEVRAQAAQWVVDHHEEQFIDLLLRRLDLDDDSSRFAVQDSLIRIGQPLLDRLALHLSVRSGPSLAPALEVAVALADPVLLPAALSLCHEDAREIRALAAELAGAIGGSAAVEVLVELLEDDAPEVRAAAARALGRVQHWPSAAALARLLGDQSWDVRMQAAVALRSLGSPGILSLRRALSASDVFAADAARHMLDLPESAMRTL